MDAVFQFDSSILLWIQDSLRVGFLNPIVNVITHLGDHGLFWIVVTLALLAFRKTRKLGLMCFVAMACSYIVCNLILKNWVARVRPYELIQGLECLVGPQHDFSFPSGHTSNSLACGWVLFRRAPKKYGVPALVLGILISLSRLYVGVHYPTDVLAGAVIGLIAACVAIPAVEYAEKKVPAMQKIL